MEKYSEKDVEWLLNLHKNGDSYYPGTPEKQIKTRSRRRWTLRIALGLAGLFFLIVFIVLFLTGPGKFALDKKRKRR